MVELVQRVQPRRAQWAPRRLVRRARHLRGPGLRLQVHLPRPPLRVQDSVGPIHSPSGVCLCAHSRACRSR
ncbi:unnamed protein product [Ectocarpus sp. 12 AP-2014]